MNTFNNIDDFNKELAGVYDFHCKVRETIENILDEIGDIEIPENEQDDFTFCFLDMEGYYTVKCICLDENGCFYLSTVSKSGDEYNIDWEQINYDMIIEDSIMTKCFDALALFEQYKEENLEDNNE